MQRRFALLPLRNRLFLKLTLLQSFAVTSLAVFVLIGFGTAYFIGHAVESSALKSAQSDAVQNLQRRLINHLTPQALRGPLTGGIRRRFDSLVRRDVLDRQVVVVKVWNPRGVVVYSTEANIIGKRFPLEGDVSRALHGHDFANVSTLGAEENEDERHFGKLLQVYIPIRFQTGPVAGAFEVYELYAPLGNQIAALQHKSYEVLGGGLLLLYILLFGIVRAGSNTISRQQEQLTGHARQLEQSYKETITSLATVVDARDSQTELHSQRVSELGLRIGRYIGLDERALQSLRNGAQLHDIGKIGVPDAILLKRGPLTEAEWRHMRMHPLIGYEMIKDISFLQDALPVVRNHHERWDGKGYPDGLSGEDIPIGARIFAIADTFDAITSDRPYRLGSPPDIALVRIWLEAGSQFDPRVVDAFVHMMSQDSAQLASGGSAPGLWPAA